MTLHLFQFAKMEWLQFPKISFSTYSCIGQLCEDLNEIVGQGIYYDTFDIRNTKWFWFVSNIITVLNNDNYCVDVLEFIRVM